MHANKTDNEILMSGLREEMSHLWLLHCAWTGKGSTTWETSLTKSFYCSMERISAEPETTWGVTERRIWHSQLECDDNAWAALEWFWNYSKWKIWHFLWGFKKTNSTKFGINGSILWLQSEQTFEVSHPSFLDGHIKTLRSLAFVVYG